MDDLNQALERLAIGQALYKGVGRSVGTKDPDSLRHGCDEELRRLYEETGVDRLRLRVRGREVGTLSAKVAKETTRHGIRVTDSGAFGRWLEGDGAEYVRALVERRQAELLDLVRADGVLPDGCEQWVDTVPEHFAGTVLRVDAAKVGDALGGELPPSTIGLLMEGE